MIASVVGDAVGRATLTLPRGDNLGMFALGEVEGEETHSVAINMIDDLLREQNVETLALVKMDIEGSEYNALRGAVKTFEKNPPVAPDRTQRACFT